MSTPDSNGIARTQNSDSVGEMAPTIDTPLNPGEQGIAHERIRRRKGGSRFVLYSTLAAGAAWLASAGHLFHEARRFDRKNTGQQFHTIDKEGNHIIVRVGAVEGHALIRQRDIIIPQAELVLELLQTLSAASDSITVERESLRNKLQEAALELSRTIDESPEKLSLILQLDSMQQTVIDILQNNGHEMGNRHIEELTQDISRTMDSGIDPEQRRLLSEQENNQIPVFGIRVR